MTREELRPYMGKKVLVSGIRDKVIDESEKISKPKMVIREVLVENEDNLIDHVWVDVPKNMKAKKGEHVAFMATVEEYTSMDKDGNIVRKLGLFNPRHFKEGKSRNHAIAKTTQSLADTNRAASGGVATLMSPELNEAIGGYSGNSGIQAMTKIKEVADNNGFSICSCSDGNSKLYKDSELIEEFWSRDEFMSVFAAGELMIEMMNEE